MEGWAAKRAQADLPFFRVRGTLPRVNPAGVQLLERGVQRSRGHAAKVCIVPLRGRGGLLVRVLFARFHHFHSNFVRIYFYLNVLLLNKYSVVRCRPCSLSVSKRASIGHQGVRQVRATACEGRRVQFTMVDSARH